MVPQLAQDVPCCHVFTAEARVSFSCHTASLKPTKLARCRAISQWCRLSRRFADLRATNQTQDSAARNKTGWHAPLAFRVSHSSWIIRSALRTHDITTA